MPRKKGSSTQTSVSSPNVPEPSPPTTPSEPIQPPVQTPAFLARPAQPELAPQIETAVLSGIEGITQVGGQKNGKVTWERQVPAQDVDDPKQTHPKAYPFNLNAELGAPDSPEAMGSGVQMRVSAEAAAALEGLRTGTIKLPEQPLRVAEQKSSTVAAPPPNIRLAEAYVATSTGDDLELEEILRHLHNERLAKQTLGSILTVFMGNPVGLKIEKRNEVLAAFREAIDDTLTVTLWSSALKGWGSRFGAKKMAQTLAGCLMVRCITAMLEEEAGLTDAD